MKNVMKIVQEKWSIGYGWSRQMYRWWCYIALKRDAVSVM